MLYVLLSLLYVHISFPENQERTSRLIAYLHHKDIFLYGIVSQDGIGSKVSIPLLNGSDDGLQ